MNRFFGSKKAAEPPPPEPLDPEDKPISQEDLVSGDTEVLDEEPRSVLLSLVSQLTKGMDLHRVSLPTFVLEPRSMLERITDYMSHPDLILQNFEEQDKLTRFVNVVRYYMSGWHIRPKGVKKPYNPILGEHFRCRWKFPDGSQSFYIAEQVSHHPPISAYFYANPEHKIIVSGDFRPKSKFLGNSAATIMHGSSKIVFTNLPDEVYTVTFPNVYARGILFGTMVLEMGDIAEILCPANDLMCELEFKVKGMFTGTYNAIGGKIKRISTGEVLHTISGKWSDTMKIQKSGKGEEATTFFDVAGSKIWPKVVAPEEEQEEKESRRLWSKVTKAILSRNLDLATDEKIAIEEMQRRNRREIDISEWQPRFFTYDAAKDEYFFNGLQFADLGEAEFRSKIEEMIFATKAQN